MARFGGARGKREGDHEHARAKALAEAAPGAPPVSLAVGPVTLTWYASSRLAGLRFAPDTDLTGRDGGTVVDGLSGWIGSDGEPFGLLADAEGLRSVAAEFRSMAHGFFREHRAEARIAVFHAGPVIRVVAELFRVGTGVQLKALDGEEPARAWLRGVGIRA